MYWWIIRSSLLALLILQGAMLGAQQNSNALSIVLTAEKARVRVGEPVTLTLTVRNILEPLPPIELQATATYTDVAGNNWTAVSEKVTIQVIRPVAVRAAEIPLPAGWEVVSGSLPMVFNLELTEGQSASQSVVIRKSPP